MWILSVRAVEALAGSVRVSVGTMLVPDWPDIVWIRLEEELGDCDHAPSRPLAKRARLRITGFGHGTFHIKVFFTVVTLILVSRHAVYAPVHLYPRALNEHQI
jgi:hypothetical protein